MSAKTIRSQPYQLNKRVLQRIWLERLRQMDLLKQGKIQFTLATGGIDPNRKIRILTEELGEIARAQENIEKAKTEDKTAAAIKNRAEEIVQLAACAIAWLELLETHAQ